MESLSYFDKNKRLLIEGRRVRHDLLAAAEAWRIVEDHIGTKQDQQRRMKQKIWKPELLWHLGNHEDRVNKWMESVPEMEGMFDIISSMDFNLRLYSNVEVVPWKAMVAREGVIFCHAPIGAAGPISSKYIAARSLADVANSSIVFGHTHRKQFYSIARYTADGSKCKLRTTRALNLGCFFDVWPEYLIRNTPDMWQGVHVLHLLGNGELDVEEITMQRLCR
jgi:hypothetical protein